MKPALLALSARSPECPTLTYAINGAAHKARPPGDRGGNERLAMDSRLRGNDDVSSVEPCGEGVGFQFHVLRFGFRRQSVPRFDRLGPDAQYR